LVACDGIEPPTRGFSSQAKTELKKDDDAKRLQMKLGLRRSKGDEGLWERVIAALSGTTRGRAASEH
jgi:hypothetical protein